MKLVREKHDPAAVAVADADTVVAAAAVVVVDTAVVAETVVVSEEATDPRHAPSPEQSVLECAVSAHSFPG